MDFRFSRCVTHLTIYHMHTEMSTQVYENQIEICSTMKSVKPSQVRNKNVVIIMLTIMIFSFRTNRSGQTV